VIGVVYGMPASPPVQTTDFSLAPRVTTSSSRWARVWDGHEVVDLAVGRLAHSSRPRSLVAQHQRVGDRFSRLTSNRPANAVVLWGYKLAGDHTRRP
jgi:hypothetical protein